MSKEDSLNKSGSIEGDQGLTSPEKNYCRRVSFSSFPVRSIKNETVRPDFGFGGKKLYELMGTYMGYDQKSLMQNIAEHMEFTLARNRYNLDKYSVYLSSALSVRDRLIELWNDTQMNTTILNPKRVYYLSIEYLLGRCFQNSILNLLVDENLKRALLIFGQKLEDLYDEETEAGLGNGGLGRLAACFLDSMATLNVPAWGYGIRYNYGIFKQQILNGRQFEIPDFWLNNKNPWEIERDDVKYKVHFYGNTRTISNNSVQTVFWENYETVVATGFDNPVPGYDTVNTINLRMWKAIPAQEFDFGKFGEGNYWGALENKQKAEMISSVLYPNDNSFSGKELRLKQEYFFVSASLQDIIRRFKKYNTDINLLPEKVAIQLNDTHPSLAPIELMRILIDEESLSFFVSWKLVTGVFSYTNHTVLPEAIEKWSVSLLSNLLPRHMEIIYLLNFYWLEKVKSMCPGNFDILSELSMIEESNPKMVKMSHLSIVCSKKVNGVAEVHTNILKNKNFKHFFELEPEKFVNVTNGITVRRWINCANPELSKFFTQFLSSSEWLVDFEAVRKISEKSTDKNIQKKWRDIKQGNKRAMKAWVLTKFQLKVSSKWLFQIMVKRIHEYKRQFMYLLYILYRYMKFKKGHRENMVPRFFVMAGKAAPGYEVAKKIIKFAFAISDLINNDLESKKFMKFIFLPNYCVSMAERIIPASDISEHISTAGFEASGTSNMKFCMNGGLLVATRDGANIEIAQEIGEENIFLFGKTVDQIESELKKVFLIDAKFEL